MTLLETAKKHIPRSRRSGQVGIEEIELAVAWAKREITLGQVNVALGKKTGSANGLYKIAVSLRAGFDKGLITSGT